MTGSSIPAHGVGRIISVVEQEVAGIKLELFVINFDKDKMTLRVPVAKASAIGMRRLSSPDVVASALQTLQAAARASSARCGAAVPRNTKQRSTRAT
jgi:CarD family transcriptional regulator